VGDIRDDIFRYVRRRDVCRHIDLRSLAADLDNRRGFSYLQRNIHTGQVTHFNCHFAL